VKGVILSTTCSGNVGMTKLWFLQKHMERKDKGQSISRHQGIGVPKALTTNRLILGGPGEMNE